MKILSAVQHFNMTNFNKKEDFITAPCFCPSYTVAKPAGVGSEQECLPNQRKNRNIIENRTKAKRDKLVKNEI